MIAARITRAGVRDVERLRDYAIPALCAALFLALAASTPAFLTTLNLANVLDQWAPTLIVACGATIVIIAGGFDLSAGAVFAASGLIAAWGANHLGLAGCLPALAFGLLIGAVNGAITTALRVHSFLVTLASALIIRGVGTAIVGGNVVITTNGAFRALERNGVGALHYPIFVATGVAAVLTVVLRRTAFGEQVHAVGGNVFAARSSGVRIDLVRVATFGVSGLLAALGGVLDASRSSGGQIAAGTGLEFTAITAVVLGGTRIFGGEGAIWRTAMGVALLALIGNGVNLSNIDAVYQQLIVGVVLLGAIAIDARTRRQV